MSEIKEEGCRGCIACCYKGDCCYPCISPYILPGFVENCPCKMCLVKGMCTVYCDDFKYHYKNVMTKYGEINEGKPL